MEVTCPIAGEVLVFCGYGMCELINCLLNSMDNYIYVPMQCNYVVSKLHLPPDAVQLCGLQITFTFRCSKIVWSPNYIYLPIHYSNVVSKLHLPPDAV